MFSLRKLDSSDRSNLAPPAASKDFPALIGQYAQPPDAIPIVAQLVGIDDMPTKINNPKPAIARLVLEALITIDGGDHD